jgi:hypothetical protein
MIGLPPSTRGGSGEPIGLGGEAEQLSLRSLPGGGGDITGETVSLRASSGFIVYQWSHQKEK